MVSRYISELGPVKPARAVEDGSCCATESSGKREIHPSCQRGRKYGIGWDRCLKCSTSRNNGQK